SCFAKSAFQKSERIKSLIFFLILTLDRICLQCLSLIASVLRSDIRIFIFLKLVILFLIISYASYPLDLLGNKDSSLSASDNSFLSFSGIIAAKGVSPSLSIFDHTAFKLVQTSFKSLISSSRESSLLGSLNSISSISLA